MAAHTPTQFGGILCWGDFKETGGGNISKRFFDHYDLIHNDRNPVKIEV